MVPRSSLTEPCAPKHNAESRWRGRRSSRMIAFTFFALSSHSYTETRAISRFRLGVPVRLHFRLTLRQVLALPCSRCAPRVPHFLPFRPQVYIRTSSLLLGVKCTKRRTRLGSNSRPKLCTHRTKQCIHACHFSKLVLQCCGLGHGSNEALQT